MTNAEGYEKPPRSLDSTDAVFHWAQWHGDVSLAENEVGTLQDFIRIAWAEVPAERRRIVLDKYADQLDADDLAEWENPTPDHDEDPFERDLVRTSRGE